ncbi:VOC family protein [Sporosarcina obsidiansis]|uniref:VOC family protein n=1 Tax=Sporosarcina obsidiansis TaxID=2660748 RepID=UPI00129B9935|nr:VOC family protein [Sporosarcina obsidiansis]
MTVGKITGSHHVGISVTNIEKSIEFYSKWFGLEYLGTVEITREQAEENITAKIFSVDGITEVKIAYLKSPESNFAIELLEYRGIEKDQVKYQVSDIGASHVCFAVSNLDDMYQRMVAEGVRFLSKSPTTLPAGHNKGAKIAFLIDPDDFIIELLQPAPKKKNL